MGRYEAALGETGAGGAGTVGAACGRGGATGARKRRRGEGEGEDDGGEGAVRADRRTNDAVAACLTAGDDDGVRATYDEASDGGREAATGGGDAGDDGGGDDDVTTTTTMAGARRGAATAATTVARQAAGSGAATGDGVDSEGGPAKRQRGERGGRKTGNHKDITRRASASRGPVNVGASGLALSAGLSEDHGAPRDFDMWATRSRRPLSIFVSTCSCAPRVIRRASQGPQGRDGRVVLPFGGARQGPGVGYVLQSAAPTGPSPPIGL